MAFFELVRHTGRSGDDEDSVKHKEECQTTTQANGDFDDRAKERVPGGIDGSGNASNGGVDFVRAARTPRGDKGGRNR